MKLHLSTFNCEFDLTTEMVTVMHLENLSEFLCEHNLDMQDFKPDFVNVELNEFVFCIDNKEWNAFINKIYAKSETMVCLHEIPTPQDFDINRYHYCNLSVIEYIIHPSYRNRAFLNQVSHSDSESYFIQKLYNELSNPKSKINSLYKLKIYWNEHHYTGTQPPFMSYRKMTLKWLSKNFSVIYCWLYENVICDFKIFNKRFRTDFFTSSDKLIQQMMDEMDRVDEEIYKEIELPF